MPASTCKTRTRIRSFCALLLAFFAVGFSLFSGALFGCASQSVQSESAVASSSASSESSPHANQRYDKRLDGLIVDGKTPLLVGKTVLWDRRPGYAANVHEEYQMPELPSGCEVVSLVIALRSMGFTADKIELVEDYLEVDGELNGYLGSPYDYSGGCFPLGVVKLANSYLVKQGSFARGHDLSGSSFDSLKAMVEAGYPVLLWTTYFIGEPWYEDGFEYDYGYYSYNDFDFDEGYGFEEGEPSWYEEEHCVVMFGVNGDKVLIADPLAGIYEREADMVLSQYRRCGAMAMTVY